ncbi:MAG: cytochrome c oxidase subunit 3 family protein [Bacteroidales bacterium]|jgi:cytochrome c oxidase subunit 3|nr:cytochrome c oxidase subunit 3 family protein [Bacteroidales bacterium]
MTDNHTHTEHIDSETGKLGMWIFLFTELFLFGGLFLVYAIFRAKYSADFHIAAAELNAFIGTINTVFLLVSSMTAAMALTAIQKGDKRLTIFLLLVTILLAALFMVNKYFEWSHKFEYGIWPGSPVLKNMSHGELLFFGLYYMMTGLHALHVLIGMILLSINVVKVKTGAVNSSRFLMLENSALYWHLVDLIWIFLFPLLYLIT